MKYMNVQFIKKMVYISFAKEEWLYNEVFNEI